MKVSYRRASLPERYLPTSKSFTSPAICDGKWLASKRVMRVIPDRPARMLSHDCATPMPTGETMPSPVTTTRRLDMDGVASGRTGRAGSLSERRRRAARSPGPAELLLLVRVDVLDRLLHGRDLLGFFVRDLGLELLFERHDELHRVQRVSAQIVDKGRLVLDLGLVDAELLGDDLLDSLLYAIHALTSQGGNCYRKERDFTRSRRLPDESGSSHCMYMPPLTCSVAPVMYPASREARKATACATSSGVPRRPSGIRSISFSRCA